MIDQNLQILAAQVFHRLLYRRTENFGYEV